MKLKFLDVRNCHALLPPSSGLPFIRRLDLCLEGINKDYNGSIDALIKQNKNTIHQAPAYKRLINSPFDIAQAGYIQTRLVNTQAIQRVWSQPALLNRVQSYENQITWKTIVPLQFLLKGWGDANEGHQCYIHSINRNMDQRSGFTPWHQQQDGNLDSYDYAGITGRNWLLRFKEHLGEMRRGSGKWFHKSWRESMGSDNILFTSLLWDVNQTYEGAMNWEEIMVDKLFKKQTSLNMIPGGHEGLKFLHKHRITNSVNIGLEDREKAITEYVRQNPRKGIPNPFIADLWKNDEYYLKVIEGRPNTLSQDQVKQIWILHGLGRSINKITKEVGALNQAQVKRVVEGKTYKRYR